MAGRRLAVDGDVDAEVVPVADRTGIKPGILPGKCRPQRHAAPFLSLNPGARVFDANERLLQGGPGFSGVALQMPSTGCEIIGADPWRWDAAPEAHRPVPV